MEKQKIKKRNWTELILESDTTVARELLQTYKEGNIEELGDALKINYENSISGAELELLNHLSDLMKNIIILQFSDEFKTQEQWEKICRLRSNIEDDLEWNDNLNENSIKNEWDDAFNSAKYLAETFVDEAKYLEKITRKEVFEQSYHPSDYGK